MSWISARTSATRPPFWRRAIRSGRKVYAFEPEPFNFRILQQTALQPEFEGKIVPMQLAVGAENGTIDLWINDRHHADHRVVTEQFRSDIRGRRSQRTLVSIDSFLESNAGDVSFVKIDVQGYELAVCQGMQDTLRQNPDITILLEFMPSAMRELGFEPSHLIDFLVERDFKIYLVHPRGKLSPGMPVHHERIQAISTFCSAAVPLHCDRTTVKCKNTETNMETEVSMDRDASRHGFAVAVLACAWPALLLATVCLLPFLNKAFLIDDPHFLTMAQQIVKHPAHPMDFDICWNRSRTCTKAYVLTPGNALMGYVLVPTVLSGAHEWMAHLTQLLLVWIAIVAMTSLILRFGWDR